MLLHVRVKPNSKTDSTTIDEAGIIKVKIKAPPVDGKANEYLTKYIASVFEIPRSKVKLLKGETAKFKTLELEMEEEPFQKKLNSFQR